MLSLRDFPRFPVLLEAVIDAFCTFLRTLKPTLEACVLHSVAWGVEWPRRKTILNDKDLIDYDADRNNEKEHNSEYEYECLDGVQQVMRALRAEHLGIGDVIVIRKEYEVLLKALSEEHGTSSSERLARSGVVITGHPGTGKTAFLIYLLLLRLSRQQPTALQLNPEGYYIFDHRGVTYHTSDTYGYDDRMRACWALVDYNATSLGRVPRCVAREG
ncbi:unnamed protein product [Peniophora sp. CBMAI 1063]|nr:unnamed protein product [Peniophora sp. CBMAI 1063]